MQNADSNTRGERPQATVTTLPRAHQPDLLSAMRRARLEDAERTLVSSDLRAAEIARLEHLRVTLAPVFQQAGRELVQFDPGLVASETPRLFIDMIAYIEMGHDRHTYRFIQDTREGPVLLAEGAGVDGLVEAVTNYIARRLVEREKALASADASVASRQMTQQRAAGVIDKSSHPFGEVLGVYLAGAASGAALIYAAVKLGWLE